MGFDQALARGKGLYNYTMVLYGGPLAWAHPVVFEPWPGQPVWVQHSLEPQLAKFEVE